MKKKTEVFICKLNVLISNIGTYVMAMIAYDFIKRDLPFDKVSAVGIIICNLIVLYMNIETGFDLKRALNDYRYYGDDDEPTITAQGFNEDFYDAYFKE